MLVLNKGKNRQDETGGRARFPSRWFPGAGAQEDDILASCHLAWARKLSFWAFFCPDCWGVGYNKHLSPPYMVGLGRHFLNPESEKC